MGSQSEIAQQIRIELASYLKRKVESITLDQSLREDLGLDSMATIELVYGIEEAFDLQIPDQDLPQLVTVGNVVSYVEQRLKPAEPTPKGKRSPSRPSPKKGG